VPFYREPDKKPKFLSQEQINYLLSSCNGLYPILYIFLKTGLRKGDLVNLRWENVDFERKCIRVESNESWFTKTGNSRGIPIDKNLLSTLKKLPRKSEYVFLNTNGKKYDYHLNERVKKLGKRLGIKNLTLHTLRHTFISHLVMSGVDLLSSTLITSFINLPEKILSIPFSSFSLSFLLAFGEASFSFRFSNREISFC